MPDISKLPKWAQKHIADLERELLYSQRHVEDLIKELTADEGGSSVTYSVDIGEERPIPERARVSFTLTNAKGWKSGVRVMLREDYGMTVLDINADRGVSIRPRASNSFYIEPSSD